MGGLWRFDNGFSSVVVKDMVSGDSDTASYAAVFDGELCGTCTRLADGRYSAACGNPRCTLQRRDPRAPATRPSISGDGTRVAFTTASHFMWVETDHYVTGCSDYRCEDGNGVDDTFVVDNPLLGARTYLGFGSTRPMSLTPYVFDMTRAPPESVLDECVVARRQRTGDRTTWNPGETTLATCQGDAACSQCWQEAYRWWVHDPPLVRVHARSWFGDGPSVTEGNRALDREGSRGVFTSFATTLAGIAHWESRYFCGRLNQGDAEGRWWWPKATFHDRNDAPDVFVSNLDWSSEGWTIPP
jgi:hypothetical protein